MTARPDETAPRHPAHALASWPRDVPLAALVSDDAAHVPCTFLAEPSGLWTWDTDRGWRTRRGDETFAFAHLDPLDAISELARIPREPGAETAAAGGWMLAISYALGPLIEPAAGRPRAAAARAAPDPWPTLVVARIDRSVAYDHAARCWAGGRSSGPSPVGAETPSWSLTPPGMAGRDAYTRAVARVLEYIRAGDVYQVNLTHRLRAAFAGSARGLAAELFAAARPWHGGYIEFDDDDTRRAVISASPELFLDADLRTGEVRTRPMKGTRPACADPEELRAAEKDRAELDMITDLMRNDLGRVCAPGSIRVESPREIERHASGVLQATSSVAGRLRAGVGAGELLGATFPPGSVTGVPKIRAMQIIDELETSPRGPYCGAMGFLSDAGRLRLNVAIRTALVSGAPGPAGLDDMSDATLELGVGAGIVADSEPDAEWRESLDKARFVLDLAEHRAPAPANT